MKTTPLFVFFVLSAFAAVPPPPPISWVGNPPMTTTGGTTGQVLTKRSGVDFDVAWLTPAVGGAPVVGYATGAGGTVTQATSKTAAVTLNKPCGQITMSGAELGGGGNVAFTVNNSAVAATDVIVVNIKSGGTAGAYFVCVGAVATGSFSITVGNCTNGKLSQALVLNFIVLKSVSS